MTLKKHMKDRDKGIIIIGLSALVLFTLVDIMFNEIYMTIGSALVGFAIGFTVGRDFYDKL